MRMRDLQLGDVFDDDDALALGRLTEHRREQRGLAGAARAGDEHVLAGGHRLAESLLLRSSSMPARASAVSENPAVRGTRTEMRVPVADTGGSTT